MKNNIFKIVFLSFVMTFVVRTDSVIHEDVKKDIVKTIETGSIQTIQNKIATIFAQNNEEVVDYIVNFYFSENAENLSNIQFLKFIKAMNNVFVQASMLGEEHIVKKLLREDDYFYFIVAKSVPIGFLLAIMHGQVLIVKNYIDYFKKRDVTDLPSYIKEITLFDTVKDIKQNDNTTRRMFVQSVARDSINAGELDDFDLLENTYYCRAEHCPEYFYYNVKKLYKEGLILAVSGNYSDIIEILVPLYILDDFDREPLIKEAFKVGNIEFLNKYKNLFSEQDYQKYYQQNFLPTELALKHSIPFLLNMFQNDPVQTKDLKRSITTFSVDSKLSVGARHIAKAYSALKQQNQLKNISKYAQQLIDAYQEFLLGKPNDLRNLIFPIGRTQATESKPSSNVYIFNRPGSESLALNFIQKALFEVFKSSHIKSLLLTLVETEPEQKIAMGMLQRMRLTTKDQAAIKIQKNWKDNASKIQLNRQNNAAKKIQKAWKDKVTRKQPLALSGANKTYNQPKTKAEGGTENSDQ